MLLVCALNEFQFLPPSIMELIYLNQDVFNIETVFFEPYTSQLSKHIEPLKGVLNIVFVNDAYIQALNKTYRGKDQATDVLSFNYEQELSELVGEVYLSVETASRQAKDHGLSLSEELVKLLIHGILHVHGYDHEEDEDYRVMYALEKAILGDIAGEFILHN